MLVNELQSLIQNSQVLSQFFILNPTAENGLRLEESFSKLVHNTSCLDPTARLQVANVADFLLQCKQILSSSDCTHSARSRLCLLFYNLSLYNTQIRRFLCGEAQLCDPVFRSLQALASEQLGPQNFIDLLRLLQILTYEKCLLLGSWTNEILLFLIAEILKVDANMPIETLRKDFMDHPLPYCLMILCNLVSRSKAISNKIKKMGNYKHLCRRLLDFLQNNSRTVVVCSLVLIGYLDEKTRDTIFSPQNISQSFLCIFNVLGCADTFMTVHISVDLLKRLVISRPICGLCSLTSTAKNFTSYHFFEKSIQRTAGILTFIDSRSEEAEKIFDLLLSFCKVSSLRRAVCSAIIQTPKLEKRLTTPFSAIGRIALMSFDDAIRPELPLHALRLLTLLLREAIEEGIRVNELISASILCDIVETSIKSPIETKSDVVKYQCMRITEGLRLAEAISNDEEVRRYLLDVVNAPLCAHINESQLISNPINGFVNKLKSSSTVKVFSNELPDWSLYGVSISLHLLRLLATLKDFSKMHKDLYWRSLKDERIIPFISFAILQGDDELVYDAFVIFTHCTQVQEFPIRLLSDLVTICSMEFKMAKRDDISMSSLMEQNGTSCDSLSDYALSDIASNTHESFRQIDELLEKMKSGMDLKDVRTSQLVYAFEKKIAMHVNREKELEQMIAMKEHALSQSERLRRICQERGNNSDEISNLRVILDGLEKQLSEKNNEIAAINVERQDCVAKVAKLKQVLESERSQRCKETEEFQQEKKLLLDENEKERELHTVLRKRYDEMTAKFDIATKTILEKQREIESTAMRLQTFNNEKAKTQEKLDEVMDELKASENVLKSQSTQIEQQKEELARLSEENKKLLKIKQTMAKMLND